MYYPAARILDPITHDGKKISGTIGPPPGGRCPGKGAVLIEGQDAAHLGCTVTCDGWTAEGPIHPPSQTLLPPLPVSGPGHGGPPDPEDEPLPEDPDEAPPGTDEKVFYLRVRQVKLSAIEVRRKGGYTEVALIVIIYDVEAQRKATYLYKGAGPGVGKTDTVSSGGKPKPFNAPRPTSAEGFEGWAKLSWVLMNYDFEFGEKEISFNEAPYKVEDLDLGEGIANSVDGSFVIGKMELLDTYEALNGSKTVFIHRQPAARWIPSGDESMCAAFLGNPLLTKTRTVFIG